MAVNYSSGKGNLLRKGYSRKKDKYQKWYAVPESIQKNKIYNLGMAMLLYIY